MFHINHTDFLSIHAKVSAIKSLKRTCPASDPVTPLCSKRIFQPTCTNAFQEIKNVYYCNTNFAIKSSSFSKVFILWKIHNQKQPPEVFYTKAVL